MDVATGCGCKEVYRFPHIDFLIPGAHKGRSVQLSTIG